MERLTYWCDDGMGNGEWRVNVGEREVSGPHIERLAIIENVLGDTYDLDHLRELVEADKDGKAVILPVKPGDTIYMINDREVISFRVGNIAAEEWGLSFEGYLDGFGVYRTSPGEKVYFTASEAETCLANYLQKEATP